MEKEKKKYKLDTGLAQIIERPLFETDKEAWEYLRKKFSNSRYATLYREEKISVPIVNRTEYVKKHNAKYTLEKIGKENIATYWIPVLQGITSHSYRGVK